MPAANQHGFGSDHEEGAESGGDTFAAAKLQPDRETCVRATANKRGEGGPERKLARVEAGEAGATELRRS